MNQIIGFDRQLKLDWLDLIAGLSRDQLDAVMIARQLHDRLRSDITGDDGRRKTIIVLTRIWVRIPPEHKPLCGEALDLIAHINGDERLWLHWGMSLLAYPFFRDVAATVGYLSRLQGAFSQAQVQRRMIESWGERTTLQRATRRLLRSLIDWQVLEEAEKAGSYRLAPMRRTENRDLAMWFLAAAFQARGVEQVLLQELIASPCAFPFDLAPFVNNLRRSERFEVSRQGLDLEMVALATRGKS